MGTERDHILARMSASELDRFAAYGGVVPRERVPELQEYRASIEQVTAAKRCAAQMYREQQLAAIRNVAKHNNIDWSIEAAESRKGIRYKGQRVKADAATQSQLRRAS